MNLTKGNQWRGGRKNNEIPEDELFFDDTLGSAQVVKELTQTEHFFNEKAEE